MYKTSRRSFLKFSRSLGVLGLLPSFNLKAKSLDSDVEFFHRDHTLYAFYKKLFNKRINKNPHTIAVCKTEAGVQKAVRHAIANGLSISVKSGGHCFEGFSLCDGGLSIDLTPMSQLELGDDHQLIAQPAAKLAQLYATCFAKRRILPSGSCASVGLAGVTLGGGYGLFSRQFGLTCDHLTGIRMVSADGGIIDSDDQPELLWACKGGGNGNFGVVTQLRYSTEPAPTTLYQHRFRSFKLTAPKAANLAKHWFQLTETLPKHAFSAFVLNGQTLTVMLTSTEHDPQMARILKQLDQLMDKNAQLKPDPIAIGVGYYYGQHQPLNFKNISAGYYRNFSDLENCIEALFDRVVQTPGMVYQINTLGGEINNPTFAQAGSYAHRSAQYLGEAQFYWQDAKQETASLEKMAALQKVLADNGINDHYRNYPDSNIKDPQQAYFGESLSRLQNLKAILDPQNRFQYAQGLSPKKRNVNS